MGKIPSSLIKSDGINIGIILVVSIFQIISLLFYTEIFESNFESVNINTKRRISEREKRQTYGDGEDN